MRLGRIKTFVASLGYAGSRLSKTKLGGVPFRRTYYISQTQFREKFMEPWAPYRHQLIGVAPWQEAIGYSNVIFMFVKSYY